MTNSFFAVVKNRNFRNLWLGQITSQIALNMLYFVLVIKVYQDTHSNAAVSLILLSFGIPSILFGIIAGSIVDQCDKKQVLIFCNFLRIFLLFSFYLFTNNYFLIFILAGIISTITQLFIPAEAPSIPELVKGDLLLTANSLFTISFYLSTMLGFILAGPMIKTLGVKNVYLFITFLMGIAYIFVNYLPALKPKVLIKENIFSMKFISQNLMEGIKFINTNSRIQQSLILMTFSQALIVTLSVLAPGFADKVLSIDLSDASYFVMGPAAIGLIIGAFWVGGFGIKFLKGTIILIGIILSGLVMIILSFITISKKTGMIGNYFISPILTNNLLLPIFLLFLLGLFNSFISVPANTILQEDSLSDIRGRVYGVLTSLTGGVSFLPVIFSGILADIFGVSKTLFILGILVILIGFYHFYQRRKIIVV